MSSTTSDMIKSFMHCQFCMTDLPDDLSPQEFIHVEVGINYDNLLQINCIRHDIVLATFDVGDVVDRCIYKTYIMVVVYVMDVVDVCI